jgi:tRNA-specific 2-thiouridylase
MAGVVMVGMSGGVDSAVAALLLLEAGFQVEGLFMKNWEEDDRPGYCAAAEDLADARAVAERLGIALHTVNFSAEYWERVFEHFLAEYRAGRTPNPDVICNKEIKFRAFLDHALARGAKAIATGHYARTDRRRGRHRLLKGLDANKDQSYFLYLLSQDQLRAVHFPVGALDKARVRTLARQAALPVHAKKDSTGICFVGERRFREFLQRYLPAQPGEIHTPDGRPVGTHAGLMYYTLGQRKGLGIGGGHGEADAAWYVVDKDLANNVLIAAQGHDHPLLYHRQLEASQVHWIRGEAPPSAFRCLVRIRYRQREQPCEVELRPDNRCWIRFDRPQRAITPGQSVVFYRGWECLGGAIIERAGTSP